MIRVRYIFIYIQEVSQTYANIREVKKDIEKLLEEIQQSTGKWYENVSDDAQSFLDAVENLVNQGKLVNSVKISVVLSDEYNVSITPTSVRSWLKEVKKK